MLSNARAMTGFARAFHIRRFYLVEKKVLFFSRRAENNPSGNNLFKAIFVSLLFFEGRPGQPAGLTFPARCFHAPDLGTIIEFTPLAYLCATSINQKLN